jgi:hypothetical protein
MPAAAPVPRHPGLLIMDGAASMLTTPGCPVCRYVSEASDRYLTWFALEGHADAGAIGRLTASLGMCPPHTRNLMAQPGAAPRLTVIYHYILRTAKERLTNRVASAAECPMCEHTDAATARALDTLLDGLADDSVRERYQALGGMCVPHLGAAAAVARRSTVAWLADSTTASMISRSPQLEWLGGETDHDADVRAVQRRALPSHVRPGSLGCDVCLAGAHAERASITCAASLSETGFPEDPSLRLCASHLADATTIAHRGGQLVSLLAWQASCHIGNVRQRATPVGKPGTRTTIRRFRLTRLRTGPVSCPSCLALHEAASQELERIRWTLRTSPTAGRRRAALCIRHVLELRGRDRRTGDLITGNTLSTADSLAAELTIAFRKNTWLGRGEPAGPEMTAWRRAAAFVDGRVLSGSVPARYAR